MQGKFVIISTQRLGGRVRLVIKPFEAAAEKPTGGVMGMLANPTGLLDSMKEDAIFAQQPDIVTISYEEWTKHQYKIDDIITISVEADK